MENLNALSKPRFRFAPSPTGYLHIGGARTALYNYLLAKKMNGTFILRIEDTDLERSTPESVEAIITSMKWLGLDHDEGPFFQTERFPLYQEHIDRLVAEKKAYRCFCTTEELDKKRAQAQAEKRKPMYDRTCLKLADAEVQKKIAAGDKFCVRFKSPDEGEIVVEDLIKGKVVIANRELDDLVIRRADGSPTYNLTVVVDDALMKITHVIRGDDHLNNTPRQIQLYQALGYPIPLFGHVPMILGADKKRLSKRHGATSVMSYQEMGYLPEALTNYLARLGWSYKDQEIFTREELIAAFSLESCSKSAGIFNPEKLLWLNGVYIREAKPEALAALTLPFLEKKGIAGVDKSLLTRAVAVSQEKVKTLVEMADMVDVFFVHPEPADDLKPTLEASKDLLKKVAERIGTLAEWSHDSIEKMFADLVAETGLGLGKIAQPVRIALTGRKISAGLYDIIHVLGKTTSLARLDRFIKTP